ncbi:MAG: hypothetical protein LBP31_02260 [Holosporales bacterium]|jgi:hypothetical protein|nr:hypothetical protein [Holosporales bacterium]
MLLFSGFCYEKMFVVAASFFLCVTSGAIASGRHIWEINLWEKIRILGNKSE